jgi:hypothetical protein
MRSMPELQVSVLKARVCRTAADIYFADANALVSSLVRCALTVNVPKSALSTPDPCQNGRTTRKPIPA